jgi:DNA-binding NarL/FixJ family response regulator
MTDQQVFRDELAVLQPRQLEILVAVCKGCTSEMIAEQMGVSINTVMWHRKVTLQKLQCTLPEAIVSAAKAGYV